MPLQHEMPQISPLTLRFFRRVVRRYFRQHFRAVQAQHAARLRNLTGPIVIFGNHTSWWDPMLVVLLGELLLPERQHYAPMDGRALDQYPILRKLGIFPIEMATPRGAARFLSTSEAVLQGGGVLWLTPQGRFADPREFPLAFKPGLGALALRIPEASLVPLAIEYPFWDERLPEALLHFGEALRVTPEVTTSQATRELEDALTTCMLALQTASISRDPAQFQTLLTGTRGTGGAYSVVRRVNALLHGKRAPLDHTDRGDI